MFSLRALILRLLALAVFGVALIWVTGPGIAEQNANAEGEGIYRELRSQFDPKPGTVYADTFKIDATERPATEETDNSPETFYRNIKILNAMAYHIKNKYMEDVDAKKLIRAGIKGMLQDLDPFSVLLEESSYDQLMESTYGRYEGLGLQIDGRDQRIRVVTPIEGTPAYRMGLQAGDIIWEIDGVSTFNLSSDEAVKMMRGAAGTSVTLTIKREGAVDLLKYQVERAMIELKTVNYYGYFPGTNIGYIRLSRFGDETGNELRAAFDSLESQKRLEGIIFDLRSNGGGLLQQAVETANLFIDSNTTVVFTRGRDAGSERYYFTDRAPLFPNGKLVVLVNGGTASASEIVAGAIQDRDRGIIMGQITYGKGLVQQIFPAGSDQDIALKLTTAKYYIPSGRCIQKPERSHKRNVDSEGYLDENVPEDSPADSLETEKEIFFTSGGRTVYGGGGIVPDIEIEPEPWQPIEMNLDGQSMFFDFAINYASRHPELNESFQVTDPILEEFRAFLEERKFDYKTSLEASLEEMKKTVTEEGKEELFKESLDKLASMIEAEKKTDFDRSREYIKRSIKREILAKLYGQNGVYEGIILRYDKAVQEALKLIQNDKEYSRMLEKGPGKKAEL